MSDYNFSRTYDVVVVGAGCGGLAAAAVLAKSGLKTLVLEKHNLPGGCASSFVRGRFEFEPSIHVMGGYGSAGNRGLVGTLFDELGIDMDLVEVPIDAVRVITTREPKGKLDIVMPMALDAYIDKMEEYVPGSRKSMTEYFNLCRETFEALDYFGKGNINIKVLKSKYGNFLKTCNYTQQEALDLVKMPKEAQRILAGLWMYLGVDLNRISFISYGLMYYNIFMYGLYIPRLRSHEFSVVFERKIREFSGMVEYNSEVENILVENGRVVGVKTAKGEYLKTDFVVANAPDHTVHSRSIYPKSEVPEMGKKICNARRLAPSMVVVYLGLNKSPEELGIANYEYLIYDSMDSVAGYESFFTKGRTKTQGVCCLNKVIPDCSPPGTTILWFCVLNEGNEWKGVTPENYFEEKTRIAQEIIEEFELATKINIKDSIEEIEIASPATFANIVGMYNGALYGYEPVGWDAMLQRVMTMDDKDEHPIHGLRLVGAFSRFTLGFAGSYLSGQAIAKLVVRDFKEGL